MDSTSLTTFRVRAHEPGEARRHLIGAVGLHRVAAGWSCGVLREAAPLVQLSSVTSLGRCGGQGIPQPRQRGP